MKNLPKGWKMHELSDFIESLESGVSVNSTEEERHAGTKRVLKISAVVNGVFLPHQNKVVTKQDEHRTKLNPKAGSIIISRANTAELVGQCGYVDKDYPDLFLPDKLWQTVLHKDAKISTRWLTYFLSSDLIKPLLLGAATGTSGSMKNISKSSFLEIPVPTPPLPEQQRIADILDACDRAINGTAKLLEKQEKRKQGLAHILFLNNTAAEVKLAEVLTKKKGKKVVLNTEGLGFPYIGAASLMGQYTQYTESADAAFCSENDVLVLWDGENAGLTATGLQGVLSTTMVALIPGPRIDNYFLHYVLQFNNEKIRALRTGSGIPHMPSSFLSSYKIKLPSLTEQHRIGGVLRACDKEIKLLNQKLMLLQQQKKGLMQRLLTGQSFGK